MPAVSLSQPGYAVYPFRPTPDLAKETPNNSGVPRETSQPGCWVAT